MLWLVILLLINVLSAHSATPSPVVETLDKKDNKIVVKGAPKSKFGFKKNDFISIHLAKSSGRSIYVLKTGQVRIEKLTKKNV